MERKNFPVNFYANTGEAPGKDYLEIVADSGTLIRQDNKLIFKKLSQPLEKIVKDSDQVMPLIETVVEEFKILDVPPNSALVF